MPTFLTTSTRSPTATRKPTPGPGPAPPAGSSPRYSPRRRSATPTVRADARQGTQRVTANGPGRAHPRTSARTPSRPAQRAADRRGMIEQQPARKEYCDGVLADAADAREGTRGGTQDRRDQASARRSARARPALANAVHAPRAEPSPRLAQDI